MASTIKLLSNTVTLGATANNVFGARVVRVVNANSTVGALITQALADTTQIGTAVIAPLGEANIVKLGTDTLTSNLTAGVFASAGGYSY